MQQAGDEGFVAGQVPKRLADLAARHGLGQRVPPIMHENFAFDGGEKTVRQAESQHQKLQRLGAQKRDGLVQVGNFPAQPEKGTVDHAQYFTGEGGIVFDAFFDGAVVNLRIVGQFQDLDCHDGQAIKLACPGHEALEGSGGIAPHNWGGSGVRGDGRVHNAT